jgi:hypothetical protein
MVSRAAAAFLRSQILSRAADNRIKPLNSIRSGPSRRNLPEPLPSRMSFPVITVIEEVQTPRTRLSRATILDNRNRFDMVACSVGSRTGCGFPPGRYAWSRGLFCSSQRGRDVETKSSNFMARKFLKTSFVQRRSEESQMALDQRAPSV